MASVRQDKRTGRFFLCFRFGGRQFQRVLEVRTRREADAARGRLEETIGLVNRGRLPMPPDADVATFLLSDGRLDIPFEVPDTPTIGELFDRYESEHIEGTKEHSTVVGERVHLRHFRRLIPSTARLDDFGTADLQEYVRARLRETWRGKAISPTTVRKELRTLRHIWNRATRQGLTSRPNPTAAVELPKPDEKPPFMTWAEIEARIARGGLDEDEVRTLWNALYLSTKQVETVLVAVRGRARHGFVVPMFVLAAHTGARRSELVRSRVDDLDFESGTFLVREKKRSRTLAVTHRRIPMSNTVRDVLAGWVDSHPGGQHTLCGDDREPLTVDEATHHFKFTLRGTKWQPVRGFHVFRHSFASNAAAAGVDQRLIDEWMGHQTEEMRRRYRHLFPEQQRAAIDRVFG